MSTAFQCDRCKQFEEGEAVVKFEIRRLTPVAQSSGTSHRSTTHREYCSKCTAGWQDWDTYFVTDPDPRDVA